MSPEFLLLAVAAIFALAGLVKGVIGLGLPTVAIGLLGLFMPPVQAAALLILPSIITNLWQAGAGGHFRELLVRLWPLLIGICIGTAIGALALPTGGPMATVGLGLALTVYALLSLLKIEFKVPPRAETPAGLICGILTGAITVATGVFVLPMVPYLQSLHLAREKLVQALGISFMASTITLAAALQHAGEFRADVIVPSIVALAAALVGMGLGQWVRLRVSPATFRMLFLTGLLALGLHLSLRWLY